jgi:hypothetical protein
MSLWLIYNIGNWQYSHTGGSQRMRTRTFIAGHLLYNLVFALVPRTIDQVTQEHQDITGMDYILCKAQDLSQLLACLQKIEST